MYEKLIFEGNYIDGERNGKGKEYYDEEKLKFEENSILKFEGEYKKGKRNGKGKEYYIDGTLEFEGEYLNGERYGEGKSYNMKAN